MIERGERRCNEADMMGGWRMSGWIVVRMCMPSRGMVGCMYVNAKWKWAKRRAIETRNTSGGGGDAPESTGSI
jgi:hypothetical protein